MTNSLLKRIPREQLSPDEQAKWDQMMSFSGDATIIEVFANSPPSSKMFQAFYTLLFYGGDVPVVYKELLRYRLSLIHGCSTCNGSNRETSRLAGISEAQLDAMENFEKGPFSDSEKAAIAFAEQLSLTNPGGSLTPALYARMKEHFSDADIVELALVGGILGGMNKTGFVLDVVIKEDYCPFVPDRAAE